MTSKERAIRKFAKAMRTAHVPYVAKIEEIPFMMTMNMRAAWAEYVLACRLEVEKHGLKAAK